MGHYRNHTRGPQRLTRIQQTGVAISQNGGVMPFTLILFITGNHYLTLNNINTTRGGVVFGCAEITVAVAIFIHGKRYLRVMSSARQA